jgi:hypothetical protein
MTAILIEIETEIEIGTAIVIETEIVTEIATEIAIETETAMVVAVAVAAVLGLPQPQVADALHLLLLVGSAARNKSKRR